MKQFVKTVAVVGTALVATACVNSKMLNTDQVLLKQCVIQETIPGAKATGAFLNIYKLDDSPLSLVSAKAPEITDRVEIHEMMMKKGMMKMSPISSYPLKKGDNIFKKGGYHIMLLDVKNPVIAGKSYNLTLTFSDGKSKSCQFEAKTVKELTPKHMKMKGMKMKAGMSMKHHAMDMKK